MNSSSRRGERASPNQIEKQRQIIDAARVVLARDGLANCTARAIADASPLTKSAIHYYFSDMDQIIDAAMAGHIGAFVARVWQAAERTGGSPGDRMVAAAEDYLATFRDIPSSLVLWNEYWIDSVRRDRTAAVAQMYTDVTEIFRELFTEAGRADADLRAHALMSFLIGAVMQEALAPIPAARLRAQLADLCGLDTPVTA